MWVAHRHQLCTCRAAVQLCAEFQAEHRTLCICSSPTWYLSCAIEMHITHTAGYGSTLNILTASEEDVKWMEMSLQRVPEMLIALAICYLLCDYIWWK